ncbi:32542_t:CDS:1, partial [Gigaspora margarita]
DSNITTDTFCIPAPAPNFNCPQNDEDCNNSEEISDLEKRSYKKHEPIKKQKHEPFRKQKHELFKKQEHKPIKKQEHKPIKEENASPTCAPLSAACNSSHPELCCSGLCSTLPHEVPGVGCCNPIGQPCPIQTPQACCNAACVTVVGSNPPSYTCSS